MKLYELTAEVRDLERMMQSDDVDQDSFLAALNGLNVERDAKIANCGLIVKELRAEIEARKTVIDSLSRSNKAAENNISWLLDYIKANIDGKVKTPLVTVTKQKGRKRIEINYVTGVFADYLKPGELDNAKIKADFESGKNDFSGFVEEKYGDDFVVIR